MKVTMHLLDNISIQTETKEEAELKKRQNYCQQRIRITYHQHKEIQIPRQQPQQDCHDRRRTRDMVEERTVEARMLRVNIVKDERPHVQIFSDTSTEENTEDEQNSAFLSLSFTADNEASSVTNPVPST